MPTTTRSIPDQYPAPTSDVEAGRIASAREDLDRHQQNRAEVLAKVRRWEARVAELDAFITGAQPDGFDYAKLAAALAERDVIRRHREGIRHHERLVNDNAASAL